MIENVIETMNIDVKKLQEYIEQDIEDVKEAKHEELLKRNDKKEILIGRIVEFKTKLNEELIKKMEEGVDVNIYRQRVDNLEEDLEKLYELNTSLASIVLPVQKMYKDLVEELSELNGGSIFDVKA